MKYKRFILNKLQPSLEDTPVVLINGPRQSGKSTLAKYISSQMGNVKYITLDDFTTLSAAKNDPEQFVSGFKGSLIIDEVQRAPELFLAIKKVVDEDRRPGRFILTGSANVLQLPNISDSLAGRIEILPLYPFSISEISGERENLIEEIFKNSDLTISSFRSFPEKFDSMFELLTSGGYPEVIERSSESRRQAWFHAYLSTILSRDVRDLASIERLSQLPDLLSLLATRSGSILNYSEISRSSGIPMSTLKRYFQILETLFLVNEIPAWTRNRSKRLVKSPKICLLDTGLLCHLLGLNSKGIELEKNQFGKILETFVINECLKSISWSDTLVRAYHYRTLAGREVDCVLESSDGRVVGIEVKSSSSISSKDLGGLKSLMEEVGDKFVRGIVIYMGSERVPFGEKIVALPVLA